MDFGCDQLRSRPSEQVGQINSVTHKSTLPGEKWKRALRSAAGGLDEPVLNQLVCMNEPVHEDLRRFESLFLFARTRFSNTLMTCLAVLWLLPVSTADAADAIARTGTAIKVNRSST
jgi:hypothetical protein